MVNSCIVTGCKQESYPGCRYSFHRIPVNNERRTLWLAAMKLDSNVSKSACVCCLHFKDEDYATAAKTRLKPEAVPSILPKIIEKNNINAVEINKNYKEVSPAHSSSSDDNKNSIEFVGLPDKSGNEEDFHFEPTSKNIKIIETSSQTKAMTTRERSLRRNIRILKQKLKRRDNEIANLKSVINLIIEKKNYNM